MSRSIPSFGRLLFALPALDLPACKAVLSACRVQSYPHDGSRLLARLEDTWGCAIHLDPRHQPPSERRLSHLVGSLRSIVIQLEDYLSSPVFSGFLSSAIRSSPVEIPQTFQQALEMGIHKEIEASIFGYRPTHLDYSCIMSPHSSDRSNPLAPNPIPVPTLPKGFTKHYAVHEPPLWLEIADLYSFFLGGIGFFMSIRSYLRFRTGCRLVVPIYDHTYQCTHVPHECFSNL